jgi:hypothetical protein
VEIYSLVKDILNLWFLLKMWKFLNVYFHLLKKDSAAWNCIIKLTSNVSYMLTNTIMLTVRKFEVVSVSLNVARNGSLNLINYIFSSSKPFFEYSKENCSCCLFHFTVLLIFVKVLPSSVIFMLTYLQI